MTKDQNVSEGALIIYQKFVERELKKLKNIQFVERELKKPENIQNYLPNNPQENPNNVKMDLVHLAITALPRESVNSEKFQELMNSIKGPNFLEFFKNLDLRGLDLKGLDLKKLDLSGLNLRGADLTGADLRYACLKGAKLMNADLKWTDLTVANLMDANLTGANLTGADLIGADLTGADLIGADLTGADLTVANFKGVIESSINSSSILNLTESNLKSILDLLGILEDNQLKKMLGIGNEVTASKYLENLINDIKNPKSMENLYTAGNQPTEVLSELQKVLDRVKSHEERIKPANLSPNPQNPSSPRLQNNPGCAPSCTIS